MDTLIFIASKIVWALIRPETLFLILISTSLFALWRRAVRIACLCLSISTFGLVSLAILPLGDFALRPLEERYSIQSELGNVSGIVVLGGSEAPVQSEYWQQPLLNDAADRYVAALLLAELFPDATVLFTGGSGRLRGSDLQESSIAGQIFLGTGLSAERLLLETMSRNTAENARNGLALRNQERPDADGVWLLVTSASHMPRAIATFCASGWTDLVPWPTDYRTAAFSDRIGWDLAGHLGDLNRGAKEWIGLWAYQLTGRADRNAPEGCLAVITHPPLARFGDL